MDSTKESKEEMSPKRDVTKESKRVRVTNMKRALSLPREGVAAKGRREEVGGGRTSGDLLAEAVGIIGDDGEDNEQPKGGPRQVRKREPVNTHIRQKGQAACSEAVCARASAPARRLTA